MNNFKKNELTISDRYRVSQMLSNYYDELQLQLTRAINNISEKNFFSTVAALNKIDVKIRLVIFYVENTDLREEYTDVEIIQLVEKESTQFFFEEVSCPDIILIKERSLCFQLGDSSEIKESLANKYLWDVDLHSLLKESHTKTSYLATNEEKIIIRYGKYLQTVVHRLLRIITNENFATVYPRILEIDIKMQMIIEAIMNFLTVIKPVRTFILDVEKEWILDYNNRFLYKLTLDNQSIRFPFWYKLY